MAGAPDTRTTHKLPMVMVAPTAAPTVCRGRFVTSLAQPPVTDWLERKGVLVTRCHYTDSRQEMESP